MPEEQNPRRRRSFQSSYREEPRSTEGMEYYPIKLESIEVTEWHPLPDGQGPPTELHVLLKLEAVNLPLVMRFKGPALLDRFISALASHRFNVWPRGDYTEEEFK